ncbi:type I polyketide synthase [Amycolatopsis sp. cmx-11-51]|uniref:type I polyketide synthase n=1 Tax=unclassified Amycolatopsis TaxID=2618356 RepID=UPI0039E51A2A
MTGADIAIVGMACRLPGARDLGEYWRNLRSGVESISFFEEEELRQNGVEQALLDRADYVRAAPVLDDPSLFDAEFFGYSPNEAAMIDPQQRIFLECAWSALEHAGQDPGAQPGPVGVYGGAAINTYLLFSGLLSRFTGEYVRTLTASDKDFLSTRVSYKLDLTGPSLTVQTACSTSLVAVHLAAQGLHHGECDLALAGGVSVRVPHRAGYRYERGGILSGDGHCRPFDADADGTIFGSGAGVVVLKRLAEALADGDTVHAVLKGSAVNNDGAEKVSYAAPSVHRQAAAVVEALADADVDPSTIGYVEAHGTGTRVGDPIEVEALTRAYREWTDDREYCLLGSVKGNLGHLDAAAGVAGLIKTVLALREAEIPASLHYTQANPGIDFAATPFSVCHALTPWQGNGPRRAAVNALGVGGTNAHLVLEQAPEPLPAAPSRPWQLLVLSAKTPAALNAATAALAADLADRPDAELADVAHTLRVGRRPFRHRRAVVCTGPADAVTGLRAPAAGRAWTGDCPEGAANPVFLIPGQGAQRLRMGAGLSASEPVFRAAFDHCAGLFAAELGVDLREIIGDGRLTRTEYTQPALFSVSYALAELWRSWGVRPSALFGHSIGELTAACLAGVFTPADAVSVVATRGRLTQGLPEGAMIEVALTEAACQSYLDGDISLAGINGPGRCVLAGPPAAIRELGTRLKVSVHPLDVSRAFHSAMVEPAVAPFLEKLSACTLRPPEIPFVSGVSGTWITADEATSPEYWAAQLRRPVRLADGFRTLSLLDRPVLLEVGPGHTLSGLAHRQPAAFTAFPSISGEPEQAGMLAALGRLWLSGVEVDWQALAGDEQRRRVPLAGYPFERRRHWYEPDGATIPAPVPPPPEETREETADTEQARTPTEAAVIGVWQAVLGVRDIGVRDNFYDLGGHSVLIPDVVARLGATFQLDLPVLSLVEAPTVAELAERIEDVFRVRSELARSWR